MISANELRIGNWVNYNNTICVIACIENDGGMDGSVKLYPVNIPKGTVVCVKTVSTSNIQSIPLTEEILLKCGFCIEVYGAKLILNGISLIRIDGAKMDLRIPQSYFDVDIDGRYMRSISFIHQLQNLYFALTGKELEIKI